MSFEQDIAKFVSKTEAKMARVVQGTVIGIGAQLVKYSPTGHWDLWSDKGKSLRPKESYNAGAFRGSWQYSFGNMSSSYQETIDESGQVSMERFREVKSQPVAGMHYLYTNSPYARVLETGNHPTIENWALTPPNLRFGFGTGANMIELTLMDAPNIINHAVTAVGER